MATGTAGTQARQYTTAQTHYLSAEISYTDAGASVSLGFCPAGARIIRGGVSVETAFNGDTTNTLNIGTTADADEFASALALGTIGVIPADEMATTNGAKMTADTEIFAAVTSTASPSAGAGLVWVEYILPM